MTAHVHGEQHKYETIIKKEYYDSSNVQIAALLLQQQLDAA